MKKLNIILFILVIICVAGTAVFLIMSPDRVPVHYDFSGKVDRIGSKYENIIVPVIAAGMGVFFSAMSKQSVKKGDESNARVMLFAGIFSVILLTVIGFYLMAKAVKYNAGEGLTVSYGAVNKLTGIGIGLLLILIGNIMPKSTRNHAVGVRTKWSLANDSVWQKSQHFGGIVTVIGGLAQVILSLFVPSLWNILVMTVIITVIAVICTVASYRFYCEDRDKEKE